MGGKTQSNKPMIQQQEQQAKEARAKEAVRQQRLSSGLGQVKQNFAGFGPDFYNRFRQAAVDWYMPQVADQYKKTRDELDFGFARAGTSKSLSAIDEAARLSEENRIARAQVVSQADTGVADLRKRVAQEQANAEAQLYATENPEVAANTALSAVKNISLAQPEMGKLASVFTPALVGGANALTGYKNEKMYQDYGLKPKTGTRTV